MRNIIKVLIALGLAVALCGCVIRPWHPHRWHDRWHAQLDVVASAPAVVRG